jgi:polyphosphate glucokinase
MENPKPVTKPASPARGSVKKGPRTLAVDVGGTGIKAELLDERGRPLTDRARIPTPVGATPRQVVGIISRLAKAAGRFDRVSVGFPGVTKDGVMYTAPNLGKGWNNFALEQKLRSALGRPVRVANDADVQGLGAVSGRGVELVITLGTGVGSVIFVDGHRIHLELGHHPFHNGKTYEDELGHRMLVKKGKKWWNKRLREAIEDLKTAFNYDRLFIGGGDSKFIRFEPPEGVKTVSNEEGLLGGIKLWQDVDAKSAAAAATKTLRHAKKRRTKPVVTQGQKDAMSRDRTNRLAFAHGPVNPSMRS